MSQIRLHYFDVFGRGETSRIILKYLGLEFEDVRYTHETWNETKTSGIAEFFQLPLLQIDGHNLVQSRAIEKYLLRRAGLISSDLLANYQSESLVGYIDDILQIIIKFMIIDKDMEGLTKWALEQLPERLRIIEKRLNESNTHLVGDSLSHADFVVFEFIYDGYLRPQRVATARPLLEASAPRLIQFAENFKSHPNVAAYLATREERDH
eukprot:CAMPEP_0202944714 /NCGR_PEP_ID=MMETSP1395-20130829/5583_1 /ASSEMBLY_ACC=CAM_ASM_000871 /TAXON_ID=5961 /ORGANISM="Blepharisma japonicum, Strain Stock R1072" /LENGTH=208 /DNA_ID=CAMNT_0049643867 /DNA_START=10 /DNA_END=636 /DNA_ORIENTATION=-